MRLHQMLIAFIPCIWNGFSITHNKNNQILYILQDFDFYYNSVVLLSSADDQWNDKAEDYANRILKANDYIVKSGNASNWKTDIMNHYLYFSSTLEHMNPVNVTCEKILVNISVTMLAYEAALNFRVCTLYFAAVNPNYKEMINICEEMFEYMEWFFSFLFRDKVTGFCEMECNKKIVRKISNSQKEDITGRICDMLYKLNLDFLKKTENPVQIPFLQDEKTAVYNLQLLQSFSPNPDKFFQPLPHINYDEKIVNGIEIHNAIWKRILEVYTENFGTLMRYLNAVLYNKGKFSKFDINELKPTYSVSFAIWQKMKDLKRIKDFPINIIRKTYNGYGEIMMRSNVVDILRFMTIRKIQKQPSLSKGKQKEQSLKTLREMTGSNEPILTCHTVRRSGFHHYLTLTKSTSCFIQS